LCKQVLDCYLVYLSTGVRKPDRDRQSQTERARQTERETEPDRERQSQTETGSDRWRDKRSETSTALQEERGQLRWREKKDGVSKGPICFIAEEIAEKNSQVFKGDGKECIHPRSS